MNSMREMTLLEFVSTLAQSHGAFKEYEALDNELAALRVENEAFREDHHKHDEWMAWAQSYFNDNPDLCMWGSRLDVGIRETLMMRDNEIAALRQERDGLKARVEELEVDLKAITTKVDHRMVRVEFTSDKYRMVKFYTRLELRHSQVFPRVESDFVKFCQETDNTTPGGDE